MSNLRSKVMIFTQARFCKFNLSHKFHIIAYTMRESRFVEQNSAKWQSFEQELRSRKTDPESLRRQLTEISEDLSVAQTFYPNRSVRVYLNGLAQQVYGRIYSNKRNLPASLRHFFGTEIPSIVYRGRRELLTAFLLLLLSVVIGMFSAGNEPGFIRAILGDAYVDQTLENIRKGNPMGVYQDGDSTGMFFRIAFNNLRVGLLLFLSGLLFSYGALLIMFSNGIMLGVFIYLFYSNNMAREFNYTVWMHGTVEILSLLIETLAGMLLGKGLVHPGTYSRSVAFSIWGRKGAMLFLATVPFIVFAAFVESFLTGQSAMPDALKLLLILCSLAFMLLYFVWLPARVSGHSAAEETGAAEAPASAGLAFKPGLIYGSAEILTASVEIFLKNGSRILRLLLLLCAAYLGLSTWISGQNILQSAVLPDAGFLEVFAELISGQTGLLHGIRQNMKLLFMHQNGYAVLLLQSLFCGLILHAVFRYFAVHTGMPKPGMQQLLWSIACALCWNAILYSGAGNPVLWYILFAPLFFSLAAYKALRAGNLSIFRFASGMLRHAYFRAAALLIFALLAFVFMLIFAFSPLAGMCLWMLELQAEMSPETYQILLALGSLGLLLLISGISMAFAALQFAFLALGVHEILSADGLKTDIMQVGTSKKAYGLETE